MAVPIAACVEITGGASSSIALDAAQGNASGITGRVQRSWKLVLKKPEDRDDPNFDVRDYIGYSIGSPGDSAGFLVCDSIEVRPDGDSRHVYIVTANFSSSPLSLEEGGMDDENADPRTEGPDQRKANWSFEVSTYETPSWWWKPIWPPQAPGVGNWVGATNPVGDMYDGVQTLQAIVNFKIEQTQRRDATAIAKFVGFVNSNRFVVGALQCEPRTVLFRGMSATPHAEIVGRKRWRGWKVNYEFSFKPGWNNLYQQYWGWDVATPVSGWNIKNVGGALNRNDVDPGAFALKLTDVGTVAQPHAIEPSLVNKVSPAHILISAPGAKETQRIAGNPVPLNYDGTPRSRTIAAADRVLVQRNQVYGDFDFTLLDIRLRGA